MSLEEISLDALENPRGAPSWPLSRRNRTVVLSQDVAGDQAVVALLSRGTSGTGALHVLRYARAAAGWTFVGGGGSEPAPESVAPRRGFADGSPVDVLASSFTDTATLEPDSAASPESNHLGFLLLRAAQGVARLSIAHRSLVVPDDGHALLLLPPHTAPLVGQAFDAANRSLGTFSGR